MTATQGQTLKSSPETVALLDRLVGEVLAHAQKITGVKSPDPKLAEKLSVDAKAIGEVRSRPLYYNYVGSGIGNGAYVELEDGSVKLDFINGIGVHLFGHAHPKLVRAALEGALGDVIHQGNLQPNREYLEFSQRLAHVAAKNSRLKYVWLSTCGTMANENALKICRQKRKGARMIVTFENAFAGRSTMMAEITDNKAYKVNLPDYNEVLRLPYYDPKKPPDEALKAFAAHIAKHGDQIGCFVFEPMLGEGGYRAATHDFYVPLLELCRRHGIPVWADEIQTFTRTGNFFAFETYDIAKYVDICTIAKTAQNGATIFSEDMKPDAGLLGGTFAGSGPALRAGTEVLRMLEEDGYMGENGKVMKIHRAFVGMLNQLNETTCKDLLREAGGLGLMVAVTPLDGSKEKQGALLKTLFNHGLICFGCGHDPYRVRFLIPAIATEREIAVAREIIEKSVLELA